MAGHDLEIYGSGNQTIDPIDCRDLSRFTVHACRNLGQHPEVVDLGSGIAISCNDACETILSRLSLHGYAKNVGIKHVKMREGEADDINLKANTAYWDSVGMHTQYDFSESVDSVIRYMETLPSYHIRNALHFYGKS